MGQCLQKVQILSLLPHAEALGLSLIFLAYQPGPRILLQLGLWPSVGLSACGLRPRDSESWRQHQERHTARVAFVAHTDVLTPPQSPEQIRPGQTLFEAMKAKKIGAQGMLG